MKKVMFAGSFNPYTIGHHSVYQNAVNIFGDQNVHIGIAQNPSKPDQNPQLLKWMTNPVFPDFNSSAIKVLDKPMLVDYMNQNGYGVLVRSVRNAIDLVSELDMATWNKKFGGVQSVFIPAEKELEHVSSSAVRSIEALGQPMNDYLVNDIQYKRWKARKPKRVIVTGRMGSGKSSFLKDYEDQFIIRIPNGRFPFRELDIYDMDEVVKQRMCETTSRIFQYFFDTTPAHDISYQWMELPKSDKSFARAKDEVLGIIKDCLTEFSYTHGVYEISAFTAYNLEEFYNDSIIVYVDNYDNGKIRKIDQRFRAKATELNTIPKVIDFVIDQKKGNVDEIVGQITDLLEG